MDFFVDIDRAASVFSLLFLFVEDELDDEEFELSFDSAICELLPGTRLPPEVLGKLRDIYQRSLENPPQLRAALMQVAEDFRDERDALVAVLRIILRLSSDEGMLYERDKERLREVLSVFRFTFLELERLSPGEQEILSCSWTSEYTGERPVPEIMGDYHALGCASTVSDEELRRTYRKLAMQFHPDRQAVAESTQTTVQPCRTKFERIQRAYESICERRKIRRS